MVSILRSVDGTRSQLLTSQIFHLLSFFELPTSGILQYLPPWEHSSSNGTQASIKRVGERDITTYHEFNHINAHNEEGKSTPS